jgi:hypothetical protein
MTVQIVPYRLNGRFSPEFGAVDGPSSPFRTGVKRLRAADEARDAIDKFGMPSDPEAGDWQSIIGMVLISSALMAMAFLG